MLPTIFNPSKLEKAISQLNPDRIYLENIRALLGTNTTIAKLICNTAVRQGYFEKRFAVECGNEDDGRIVATYNSQEEIPETITCDLCEMEGKKSTFKKEDLRIYPIYKYIYGNGRS
ncbi:hypothetical protein [Aegicerativicinus sediminis]|uniref:hypothetical protein n=1 Tax=Aegicerativicinus sediminis TaxID=2893202 RepID=UPI001E618488|nr:hypothetical protein [Aegicerativicinus sediminis]